MSVTQLSQFCNILFRCRIVMKLKCICKVIFVPTNCTKPFIFHLFIILLKLHFEFTAVLLYFMFALIRFNFVFCSLFLFGSGSLRNTPQGFRSISFLTTQVIPCRSSNTAISSKFRPFMICPFFQIRHILKCNAVHWPSCDIVFKCLKKHFFANAFSNTPIIDNARRNRRNEYIQIRIMIEHLFAWITCLFKRFH